MDHKSFCDTFMTAGEPEPDSGKHHDHGSSWEPHIVIGPVHFGAWHDVPAGVAGSYICQYQAERKRNQKNRKGILVKKNYLNLFSHHDG